jgi:glutaredoxin-related protein
MQAGILLIYKCEKTIKLINEWNNICSNNYNFIDDSNSIHKNFKEFIEHRHDQSVFNLLIKKYNLINYDMDPTCFGIEISEKTAKEYFKNAYKYPIWSCRNRSGKSLFEFINA